MKKPEPSDTTMELLNTLWSDMVVKENPRGAPGHAGRRLTAAATTSLASLLVVMALQRWLPPPRPMLDHPNLFSADNAYDFLVNLTSIGPRVAGSIENEEIAPKQVVRALQDLAASASPYNRLDIDMHRASGAFPIKFFDGMSNVYRDVGMVVGLITAAGAPPARPTPRPKGLLLNCHYDTVPDSPGASDDGAGCAVVFEVGRALLSSQTPLPRPTVLLLNGAEENIMQASHAFVTTHRWAHMARVFVNVEACGAGGREVLFQAGPNEPWLLQVYSSMVPYPFASSLAQELFESGIVPGDTDFRVFRDFGNMSGVDLAWSSNGYVYHTLHDDLSQVPKESLQRAGDNVMALVHGIQQSPRLDQPVQLGGTPVYFDVVGTFSVALPPIPAFVASLVLLLASLFAAASPPHSGLVTRKRYLRLTFRSGLYQALSVVCGIFTGALFGGFGVRAPLLWLCRPWLLGPLAVGPALTASWLTCRYLHSTLPLYSVSIVPWRGLSLVLSIFTFLLSLRGIRSAFIPGLWAVSILAASCSKWGLGLCVLSGAVSWSLAMDLLAMFVPVMARAGAAVAPDLVISTASSAVCQLATLWLLPFAANVSSFKSLTLAITLSYAVASISLWPLGAQWAYSAQCPQRAMLFRARRVLHAPSLPTSPHEPRVQVDYRYWMPDMDVNFPSTLVNTWPEFESAYAMSESDCEEYVYCGAPYYLPVRGLVSRAHWLPTDSTPIAVTLNVNVDVKVRGSEKDVKVVASGCHHIVAIISPPAGSAITRCSLLASPQEGAPWGDRKTYFFFLHDALDPNREWDFNLTVSSTSTSLSAVSSTTALSISCHGLAHKRSDPLKALLNTAPDWLAATGWDVDLHLYWV